MNEFSHLKNKLLAEQVEDQIYHYILDTPIEPGGQSCRWFWWASSWH